MHYYALLALAPLVRACTNPDTDPCASFMTAQVSLLESLMPPFGMSQGHELLDRGFYSH